MKRKITILALIMCVAFIGVACGNTSENKDVEGSKQQDEVNYPTTKEIVEKITNALDKDTLPEMTGCGSEDENAQETFEYLCDANYSDVEDYYISYSTDAKNSPAQEILVIRFSDENKAKEGVDFLQRRVEQRKSQFMTYKPDALPVLNKAIVSQNKCFAVLIVCDDASAGEKAFIKAID